MHNKKTPQRLDYDAFMYPDHEGEVWFQLEEGYKLVAGWLPVVDDSKQLSPVLKAPDNRAKVSVSNLLADFHEANRLSADGKGDAVYPCRVRDEVSNGISTFYVHAADFIKWAESKGFEVPARVKSKRFLRERLEAIARNRSVNTEHDATYAELEKLHDRIKWKEAEIAKWERIPAPDALNLVAQESELKRLNGEREGLKQEYERLRLPIRAALGDPEAIAAEEAEVSVGVSSDTVTLKSLAYAVTDSEIDTNGVVAWQAEILEQWSTITKEHGAKPSARNVMKWLKKNGRRDRIPEKQPLAESLCWNDREEHPHSVKLCRIGNVLSEWRREGKIPRR